MPQDGSVSSQTNRVITVRFFSLVSGGAASNYSNSDITRMLFGASLILGRYGIGLRRYNYITPVDVRVPALEDNTSERIRYNNRGAGQYAAVTNRVHSLIRSARQRDRGNEPDVNVVMVGELSDHDGDALGLFDPDSNLIFIETDNTSPSIGSQADTLVHEILHWAGFPHNRIPGNIMNNGPAEERGVTLSRAQSRRLRRLASRAVRH